MAISDALIRWFSARPHLVGSSVALLLVIAAGQGVLETLLRPHFNGATLVAVLLFGYAVGWWSAAGAMLWLDKRRWSTVWRAPREERGPTPTPIRDNVRKLLFVLGMTAAVIGVVFLPLMVIGWEHVEGWGALIGAVISGAGLVLAGLSYAHARNGKPKT
ncbi:hypothetical protein J2S43_003922 [Catenuloplanes nepalensis]|uniref:Transmembrane protein n=1 Tax=Catenuloplanes nepalensis TaxID=587533 RepID=A0ABT9MVE5_9ACTN|nr:hypothetical protein [Catenuloplanes nepalensis]MDP9795410.1 hypothetical protein [Catenuloplanes nepalensis]